MSRLVIPILYSMAIGIIKAGRLKVAHKERFNVGIKGPKYLEILWKK